MADRGSALLAAAALAALCGAAPSGAQVLGFDAPGRGPLGPGGTHSEAGFVMRIESGEGFGTGPEGLGRPGGAFVVGYAHAPTIGDTAVLARRDGAPFSLRGLRIASSFEGLPSDAVRVLGMRDGRPVGPGFALRAGRTAWEDAGRPIDGPIDALRIVVIARGFTRLLIDEVDLGPP